MKILHTSDWHLGKNLENFSRLPEQQEFLEELAEIAERNKIDLIIVSGDIYDSYNPSAAAEALFYKSMKTLSKEGKRPVVVIAGNHDNPERLTAASPLAYDYGIILLGMLKSQAMVGVYPYYSILNSGDCFLELEINNEKIMITAISYPSEKRLNEIIFYGEDEESFKKCYSDRIGELFQNLDKNFRDECINITLGHFYVKGYESSDSERDISLGGAYAVEASMLSEKAQYIGLGHLHRPQKVKAKCPHVYYSGSPIQYSKSEINYAKCVYIVELFPKTEAKVDKVFLRCYKPIEIWRFDSIEQAIEECDKNAKENIWVYIEIKTTRTLLPSEIRQIRTSRKDIIEINVILNQNEEGLVINNNEEKTILEEFQSFYKQAKNHDATEELNNLFLELINEEEEEEE